MANSQHVTVTGTAANVTFANVNAGKIEVLNRSADTIYFRSDGTVAVVGASGTNVVAPNIGASLIVDNETPAATRTSTGTVVSLISSGASSAVSVRAL